MASSADAAAPPLGGRTSASDGGEEERPPSGVRVQQEGVRSTGSFWTDFQLAVKRISPVEDLKHIGEIPCARNSLLVGIASGFGIGVIRGINTKPFVAANWAVGSFLIVSVGTWNICRASIRREREQVRVVVEQMAERRMRRAEQDRKDADSDESKGRS